MASNTLQVFVHTLRYEAEGIISIELRAPDQKTCQRLKQVHTLICICPMAWCAAIRC